MVRSDLVRLELILRNKDSLDIRYKLYLRIMTIDIKIANITQYQLLPERRVPFNADIMPY